MERKRIEVLEQNGDWAVCLKPVGVESEKEMPELLSAMLGGMFFPVHRLDLNVGGLMVFARNRDAAARMGELIREGSFRKAYMALVHGRPPESGRMEDLLWKDARAKKVYVVQRMRKGVKTAALSYETLWTKTEKDQSLVLIRLETGRTHQIRVQFASRGFPLVGDHKYGARDQEKEPRLFSCGLRFPWDGEERKWTMSPSWASREAKKEGTSSPAPVI